MRRVSPVVALVAAAACHASPAPADSPRCAEVAAHVQALLPAGDDRGLHARQVRDVIERRCRIDHWAPAVTACMFGERSLHAAHHCQDQLVAEQRSVFARELAEIDAPPPPPHDPNSDWPSECDEYKAAIESLQTCASVSAPDRDQLRQSFEQVAAAWNQQRQRDMRDTFATACKTGAESIRLAAAGCGTP